MKIGNCNDAPRVIGQEACTDAAHIVEKIAGDGRVSGFPGGALAECILRLDSREPNPLGE